jgi:hypothetical protein
MAPAVAGTASRSRVSMFSLPRPRTSRASRNGSRPCRSRSQRADALRAVLDDDLGRAARNVVERRGPVDRFHAPPWRIIGVVRRSAPLKASYENRSRSASQHSLTSSFSSGTTRITCAPLTWTIRLAPVESCGLTLFLRDSSQVRAL